MGRLGSPQELSGLTRRGLLEQMAALGGAAMLIAGLDAFGMSIASANALPPKLGPPRKPTKVAILGAGIAGLAAAYELSKAGYDITLIEARPFAGGRIQTARKGTRWQEIGGSEQICDFDDGLYFNHGAMRIPYSHQSTLHYTRELGLPLEIFVNDNTAAYMYSTKGTGALKNKRIRKGELTADLGGYTSELLAKACQSGFLDQKVGPADREMLVNYLTHFGYLSKKDHLYLGADARGYLEAPGAGTLAGSVGKPYDLSDLLNSNLWFFLRSVQKNDQPPAMFQVAGGTDRLPKAMAAALPKGAVRYSTQIERIRQSGAGVQLSTIDRSGRRETIDADYCICTLPLSVLKGVDNGMSPSFRSAMDKVAYGSVGKLGLQMGRRFWEEPPHTIYGGHIFTDNFDIFQMTLPSSDWQSQKGVVLGYYNFQSESERIGAMTPAQRARIGLDFGKKIFPEYEAAHEKNFSVAWHRDPFALGGWSGWSDEARRTAYPVLLEPDGRIYLAGEHLSYLNGWIAGAIESAWQQSERLHARVMAN